MKEKIIKIPEETLSAYDPDNDTYGDLAIAGIVGAAEEISKLFGIEPIKTMAEIKPFTNEFVNMLLVNALRFLNDEQRFALTHALFERIGDKNRAKLTSRWIPVGERLPEIPEGKHWVTCLVCQEGHVYIADYIGLLGDKPRWEDCGSAGMYGVTHWQNLPELPEGK